MTQTKKRRRQRAPHGHRRPRHLPKAIRTNGWVYISISGQPFERGYQYGHAIPEDMKQVKRILDFIIYNDYGVSWDFFVAACKKYITPTIQSAYPEYYAEMCGFARGCSDAGCEISEDYVIAWNNYFTLTESWWANMPEEEAAQIRPASSKGSAGATREGGGSGAGAGGHNNGSTERCSAFMAVGDYTADGRIVMAHNNFSNFVDGQLAKYVVDLNPAQGYRMLMLGFPGWIWSGTDFFVTSAGIMGTETTIGGFLSYEQRHPISCRIRQAMQYGRSLDEYADILVAENSGDYANSWLFGDVRSNEIMRVELGLKYVNVEKTKNGYFVGFNATYDPRIRNLECANSGFDDIRRHQGSRRVRLTDLMETYKGRIDSEMAKAILADHFDVYLKRELPCSRTVCAHYEMDAREFMSDPSRPKPFQPRGALDGNVCDSAMAEKMSFEVRWGNSCGTPFDPARFCDEHREWKYLEPYLEARPQQPWTVFRVGNKGANTAKQQQQRIQALNMNKKNIGAAKVEVTVELVGMPQQPMMAEQQVMSNTKTTKTQKRKHGKRKQGQKNGMKEKNEGNNLREPEPEVMVMEMGTAPVSLPIPTPLLTGNMLRPEVLY